MRICLLGDFSGNPDEGMRKVSNTIKERLLKTLNLFYRFRMFIIRSFY